MCATVNTRFCFKQNSGPFLAKYKRPVIQFGLHVYDKMISKDAKHFWPVSLFHALLIFAIFKLLSSPVYLINFYTLNCYIPVILWGYDLFRPRISPKDVSHLRTLFYLSTPCHLIYLWNKVLKSVAVGFISYVAMITDIWPWLPWCC